MRRRSRRPVTRRGCVTCSRRRNCGRRDGPTGSTPGSTGTARPPTSSSSRLAPQGPPGTSGIAFAIETAGATAAVADAWREALGAAEHRLVVRPVGDDTVPWFHIAHASPDHRDGLKLWAMEYHADFLAAWHPTRTAARGITRAEVLERYAAVQSRTGLAPARRRDRRDARVHAGRARVLRTARAAPSRPTTRDAGASRIVSRRRHHVRHRRRHGRTPWRAGTRLPPAPPRRPRDDHARPNHHQRRRHADGVEVQIMPHASCLMPMRSETDSDALRPALLLPAGARGGRSQSGRRATAGSTRAARRASTGRSALVTMTAVAAKRDHVRLRCEQRTAGPDGAAEEERASRPTACRDGEHEAFAHDEADHA